MVGDNDSLSHQNARRNSGRPQGTDQHRRDVKQLQLFAVAAPGLEQVLHDEMKELGLPKCTVEDGGVSFRGTLRELYRANLHLRTPSRILVRIAGFHATAFHELERHAKRVSWSNFIAPGATAALRVTCKKSRLYHSDAVAERIGGAISSRTGVGISAPEDESDQLAEAGPRQDKASDHTQLFVVRVFRDEVTISADSSGAHLHMRGYREAVAKAPLRETLAATLIRLSGWRGDKPLMDPMCGAGTIPIEAALYARDIAPGISRATREPRAFSFVQWPDHDPKIWDEEVAAARSRIREHVPVRIIAADRDAGAIQATVANARRAGVEGDIEVEQRALSDVATVTGDGIMICNPPYGKRIGEEKLLRDLYARLGSLFRVELAGWQLTMLSANSELERHTGLDLQLLARTTNGGIPVRIVQALGD
jgi:putative N6-adenine-specific DNA methylase